MNLKRGKSKSKTMELVFHQENDYQLKENIALALLTGGYNPLREYSTNGIPIDPTILNKYENKLRELLQDTIQDMKVDFDKVKEV